VLKEEGYLSDEMMELVSGVLYKWLYGYLSKTVLGREKVRLDDARFLFSILGETMAYLLKQSCHQEISPN